MKTKNTFLLSLLISLSVYASAQIRLPRLVRDSMVLQRETPIKLWGWSSPKEKITISFNHQRIKTTADIDGKWITTLPAMKAGGPYNMIIDGKNHIELKDVLIGDVWFCSGQSNMVHQMSLHKERYAAEIASANYPQIRQFWIPTLTNLVAPQDDLPTGYWRSATAQDISQFSAVAYFFAKNIYDKYKVPIGLINASVGGTPIESWTSEEGLHDFNLISLIQRNKDTAYVNDLNRRSAFLNLRKKLPLNKGLTETIKWFDESYTAADWKNINLPGYWEDQGLKDLDGIVWYRKEINLPSAFTKKNTTLALGRIVDADNVYINGKPIGNTTYQYPQRRYNIPAGLLKEGKNLITVMVTNYSGKGGFVTDKPYYITNGPDTIDLKGTWNYKIGSVFIPERNYEGISLIHQPTALYNAMVAPIKKYSVKGFLWYQGESNAGKNPQQYQQLLPALINDWRKQFDQPDAPFIYAQLPNFMDVQFKPSQSDWATIREAQRKTLSIPNTAMAVTIELGEWNDIHPDNKKDVGERMALAARKLSYGEKDLIASGPLYDTAIAEGNKIIIHFKETGSGINTKAGDSPGEFAIAGFDKRFVWANTKLEGNKVIVWNDVVPHPRFVRYAWAYNPANANLYNKEGLPASPFEAEVSNTVSNENPWNGKKAAIVLTYDDALDNHLSKAIPALDSFNFKGTFYICNDRNQQSTQLQGWRRAAFNGHELGNHTVFHPCNGGKGREWVQPENDLRNYSLKRIWAEARTMNIFLHSIDGKTNRTFAFPCADASIGDTLYINQLKKDFIAARSVRSEMLSLNDVKLYDLPAYMINNETGEQLIALVKKAIEEKKLLIFLFHGVGGDHALNVSATAHSELLQFLKDHESDIWITPLVEAAIFIRENQNK